LFQGKSISEFCYELDQIEDEKILGNETLEIIIGEIWKTTRPRILWFIFVPYMLKFILFIVYISFIFQPDGERTLTDWIIQIPILLFSLIQLFMVGKQMLHKGASHYFLSVGVIWNLLDIASLVLVSIFIVMNLMGYIHDANLYIIGGLAVFCLWLKLFYFMRMFQDTAAFVRMIIEMLIDIKIFLFIFFVGILAFSNCLYVLDMYTRLK